MSDVYGRTGGRGGEAPGRRRRSSSSQSTASNANGQAAKKGAPVRGRVRARDPFELIRWLALSQTDPRKALAELIQNSMDAGASRIRVTRVREKGLVCIRILDDGEGPIPELDRPAALHFIATNIGHSRKRSLSPQERLQLMTQGQYGIGLLGFWAIGERLEMRSALPGQKAHRLILHRDSPDFVIEPLRGRLDLDEKWTEVVVASVHKEVSSVLSGRRVAEYLASELRGQLLTRALDLKVEDKIARGRSQKSFDVRPHRFLGQSLQSFGVIPVPGYLPIKLELYHLGEDVTEEAAVPIAVYAAGTVVADSFRELADLRLDRAPWTDRRLTGFVDFPGFTIAPGSRRGLLRDAAAEAFARALATIEPKLRETLEEVERNRTVEQDRTLIKNLKRAFRDFYRQRPRYEMLPVLDERFPGSGPGAGPGGEDSAGDDTTGEISRADDLADDGTGLGDASSGDAPDGEGRDASDWAAGSAPGDAADRAGETTPPGMAAPPPDRQTDSARPHADDPELSLPHPEPDDKLYLLPPGPLSGIRFVPRKINVPVGETRRVRAEAIDADGRVIPELMEFDWELEGDCAWFSPEHRSSVSTISDTGRSDMLLRGAETPGRGILRVEVRTDDVTVSEEIPLRVIEGGAGTGEGIPDPEFLDMPAASWRSRMEQGRWQVNSGHPDFRRTADRPALRLRYLAMLFSKEIVLRSHRDPRLEAALEQMVEVSTFADRNLSTKKDRD